VLGFAAIACTPLIQGWMSAPLILQTGSGRDAFRIKQPAAVRTRVVVVFFVICSIGFTGSREPR
jgi:hypothetical protein